MADNDLVLMAHLLRRAGFGATRDELDGYVAKGYEATVEELLHPEKHPGSSGRRGHLQALSHRGERLFAGI